MAVVMTIMKKPARSGSRRSDKSGWAAPVEKKLQVNEAVWKKKAEHEEAAKAAWKKKAEEEGADKETWKLCAETAFAQLESWKKKYLAEVERTVSWKTKWLDARVDKSRMEIMQDELLAWRKHWGPKSDASSASD